MNSIKEEIKQIKCGWKSQKIRLVGTPVNKSEFCLLKETLMNYTTVRSLEISLCEVTEDCIEEFAKNMKNFNLMGLQLVHIGLTEKSAISLATAIQECPIKKLDLSFNNIGPKGAKVLANALTDCGLESLHLHKNGIGSEGAIYIANVLKTGKTSLNMLDLSKNRIDDQGASELASALPHSNIKYIILDYNDITVVGITSLCKAIENCPKILELSLAGNNISDSAALVITEALINNAKNLNLERLNLSSNILTDVSISELAKFVKVSRSLQRLEIKHCRHINNACADMLYESVKHHISMKTILLEDTSVSEDNQTKLNYILKNNHTERSKLMTTFCSIYKFPRLGIYSMFYNSFPEDLLRNLSKMLDNTHK